MLACNYLTKKRESGSCRFQWGKQDDNIKWRFCDTGWLSDNVSSNCSMFIFCFACRFMCLCILCTDILYLAHQVLSASFMLLITRNSVQFYYMMLPNIHQHPCRRELPPPNPKKCDSESEWRWDLGWESTLGFRPVAQSWKSCSTDVYHSQRETARRL